MTDKKINTETKSAVVNVAVFASGAGSNAEKIITFFKHDPLITIVLIASNNRQAGVIEIAKKNKLPVLLLEKTVFFSENSYLEFFKQKKIDWIILAGFLWKMPVAFTCNYTGRIINIHPALLPAYGGKGMYGRHVHEAVILNKEKESGISIHFVDEIYDHGKIIFQAKCPVLKTDNAYTLAEKIHVLEHLHYAPIIREVILNAKNKLNQKA